MPSSLFPQKQGASGNSILATFKSLVGNNPQTAFNQLYQSNPEFRQFADSMQGKTPEQAFRENGLDFNQFRNLF